MSVAINWPFVGGIALICLAPLIWFGPAIWRGLRSIMPQAAQTDGPTQRRSADAPAPPGAVEYIVDIEDALLGAPPEMVLQCLRNGMTRDAARSVRIQGLLKDDKPSSKGKS